MSHTSHRIDSVRVRAGDIAQRVVQNFSKGERVVRLVDGVEFTVKKHDAFGICFEECEGLFSANGFRSA